jgi:hypothetical protein
MTAETAVTLEMRVEGPREPKTEDEEPPKAEPSPELLLDCKSTLIMRIRATKMWSTVIEDSRKLLSIKKYSF